MDRCAEAALWQCGTDDREGIHSRLAVATGSRQVVCAACGRKNCVPLCTEPRVPHVPHPQIIGVHPQLLVLGGRFRFRDVFLDSGGGRRQCTDVGTPEMQVPLAEDFSLSAARCRVAMSSPVPDFCGRAGPEAGGSAVPMLVVLERQR